MKIFIRDGRSAIFISKSKEAGDNILSLHGHTLKDLLNMRNKDVLSCFVDSLDKVKRVKDTYIFYKHGQYIASVETYEFEAALLLEESNPIQIGVNTTYYNFT